ncbi:hypothetical protein WA026_013897, partial [Henosepilachna vigintioctopunctata]
MEDSAADTEAGSSGTWRGTFKICLAKKRRQSKTQYMSFRLRAPAPVTNDCAPAPVTNDCGPAPVTNDCAPAPVTNDCAPALVTNDCAPAPVTNDCAPAPVTNDCAPASVTNDCVCPNQNTFLLHNLFIQCFIFKIKIIINIGKFFACFLFSKLCQLIYLNALEYL